MAEPESQVPQEDDDRTKGLIRMMVIFMIIIILASVGYFFREPLGGLFESVVGDVGDEGRSEIVIAYGEGITSFDPANYETRNRNFLGNVYEGLVRFDKNLDLESALAVSWGQVDDLTWEFKLREDVIFHDGTPLDSVDVSESITYAYLTEASQLKTLLSSIAMVEIIDELTIRVTTNFVDPILPNRLAQVYVYPSGTTDFETNFVGTGPYYPVAFDTYTSSDVEQSLELEAFSYYWGYYPSYDGVTLVSIPNKEARSEALKKGDVDMLYGVALDEVEGVEEAGAEIVTQSSLEVNFLLFNTDGLFGEKDLREAFAMAIDKDGLVSELNGYAKVAEQFVAAGVSGYSSGIHSPAYDPSSAQEIFDEYEVDRIELDMVQGMEFLGDYIQGELMDVGVSLEINYWDSLEYSSEMIENAFDIYFMGWKSDLGDAFDMYETLFASYGSYNGGYSNSDADKMIGEAALELNIGERIKLLKEIMKVISEDDVAGVPLFEYEIVYGVSEGVEFSPRIDGYVWAAELR